VSGPTLAPHTVRAIREAAAAWLAGRRFAAAPVLDHDAVYAVAQTAGVLAGLYGPVTAWHRAAWFACERELMAQTETVRP
jgi:hypothetical protein